MAVLCCGPSAVCPEGQDLGPTASLAYGHCMADSCAIGLKSCRYNNVSAQSLNCGQLTNLFEVLIETDIMI